MTEPTRRPMKRRRKEYSYAEHAPVEASGGGGDLTLKPEANAYIVRPDFNSLDSLIFRPMPCLTDAPKLTDAKWMPYRNSSDPMDFTDWCRAYPAARYIGMEGEQRYSFLLYDPAEARETGYDPSQNPYILLWEWARKAKKKRLFPSMQWLDLIDGRDAMLKKPDKLFFYQGLVFARGGDIYVKDGPPRGAGTNDRAQIIQLTGSAGRGIETLLNEVRDEDFPDDADPKDPLYYDKIMVHGDPVSLRSGRFIRIQNPKQGETGAGGGAEVGESETWEQGGDAYSGKKQEESFRGYDVSIDDVLTIANKRRKMQPRIEPKAAKLLKSKVVFWDEVLNIPDTPDLCYIVAKALKFAAAGIRRAWADHPDYLSDDVEKLLNNSTQHLAWGTENGDGANDLAEETAPARQSSALAEEDESPTDSGGYDDDYESSDEVEADETAKTATTPAPVAETTTVDDEEYDDDEGGEAPGEEFADELPTAPAEEAPVAEETPAKETPAAPVAPVDDYDDDSPVDTAAEEYDDFSADDFGDEAPAATTDGDEEPVDEEPVDEEPVATMDSDEAEMTAAFDAADDRSSARAPSKDAGAKPKAKPKAQAKPKPKAASKK